jgi:TM2 domain-containing membrane protein YozV
VWEIILFNDSAMVLVIEKIPNTGTNSFENPTLGTTTLIFENNKSYAFIPQQDQGKAYTIQEGSYIQTNIKYLIVDGNAIKHWDTASSSYIKVSELPLTADKFQAYGDDTYHKERTGLIATSPSLKIWSPLIEMPAPKITQTIKPKPIIVNMKDDISFSEAYIKDIMNAVVTFDNTGSGIIAFIVSIDGGVSWKSWNGSAWALVDITNIQDAKSKGMSGTTLQGITEAQWTSLGISSKKIRFAWYMEVTASTDILKLKQIRVNYNVL